MQCKFYLLQLYCFFANEEFICLICGVRGEASQLCFPVKVERT